MSISKRIRLLVIAFAFAGNAGFAAASQQRIADYDVPVDLVNGLREARSDAKKVGDRIWLGFARAPFGFVLVSAEREILLCDDRLPDGFVSAPREPTLRCPRAVGPRSWRQESLLASMPVFGPPSVIVMGSPKTTLRSLADWKMTILHEHFHQWQSALPDYFARVEALQLANGDETGMWMLNYAFPYHDAEVGAAYKDAAVSLAAAIEANDGVEAQAALTSYRKARAVFQSKVSPAQWRYFEFQLWQEGVARWTEFTLGEASKHSDVASAARDLRTSTLHALRDSELAASERISVYAYGAGEAMLLSRTDPNWRQCYPNQLSLGPLFAQRCIRR